MPTAESFRGPIADDDFDISLAKSDQEKQILTDARASKLWRTLRIASKSRLNIFDKIEDGNNLDALFELDGDENKGKNMNGLEECQDSLTKMATTAPIETETEPVSGENGTDTVLEAVVK